MLIVGAGPAGTSAARAAADAGAKVLVLEKRKEIGKPVQCAEYIPRLLSHQIKIPAYAFAQEIQGMKTFLPDGECIRKSAPGYILHRDLFDHALAAQAEEAGAEILTRAEALSRDHDRIKIKGLTGEKEVKATVVIGADGPDSVVGNWIDQKNTEMMWAVQHTVYLKSPSTDTEVYFDQAYSGGYAWLFPKGALANVGVGVRRELGGSATKALEVFKNRIKDRIGEVVEKTAGRIPAGGPLPSIDEKSRTLLVGDAAGHTHAVTGGGIPQAVLCGAMAGRAAAAFAKGDKVALKTYRNEWRNAFGSMLERAAERRRQMEAGWDQGDLTALLRKSWIAFREYYHDA